MSLLNVHYCCAEVTCTYYLLPKINSNNDDDNFNSNPPVLPWVKVGQVLVSQAEESWQSQIYCSYCPKSEISHRSCLTSYHDLDLAMCVCVCMKFIHVNVQRYTQVQPSLEI